MIWKDYPSNKISVQERDKMASTKITLPATMKVSAAAGETIRFTPYKENFIVPVAGGESGSSLSLKAETVGQYFYYLKQGFKADSTTADIVINSPAKITIKNNAAKVMSFIPYRENFSQEVAVGDDYEFEAKTAGQVLYYMAQDTNGMGVAGGLDVTQEAIS